MEILYQDDVLLAVNKPSGLLVHRGWGRDTTVLVNLVRDTLGVSVVHPLHRLDRQTSGVVLFAFNAEEGKIVRLRSVGYEKGGITTDLKDRPDVRFELEILKDEPGKQASADGSDK